MSKHEQRSVVGELSRPPHRLPHVLRAVAVVASVAVVVAATGGWVAANYYGHRIATVNAFPSGARPAEAKGGAENILVLGSDTREGLTKAEERQLSTGNVACDCTDTIMLLHFEKDAKGATIVSFPRDLMVTVPAFTDKSGRSYPAAVRQINTAYTLGGPQLAVKTIESLTNIRVDHYVQVRFSGVVHVVSALHGVNVCVKQQFSDKNTHLTLTAGEHTLNGIDALKYVRLRHIGDGSDLGRIQRQQQFLVNALAKATSAGVLASPLTLKHLLDATTKSFVVDNKLGTTQILSLANRLRSMDRKNLVLLTVPNEAYVPDPNRVQLQQPEADAVFTALRTNAPATSLLPSKSLVAPSTVSVLVYNGTGKQGLGSKAANSLAAVGFSLAGPARNAKLTDPTRTEIRYGPTSLAKARTLAAALPGAVLVASPGLGSTVHVVVGSSFTKAVAVKSTATSTSSHPLSGTSGPCSTS